MKPRALWRRKRVWVPGLAVVAIAAACLMAWYGSGESRLVLYNETGERVVAVRVKVCGQSRSFGGLGDEESVGWTLEGEGAASEIALEVEMVGERSWTWRGGYVEPAGGGRVVLRLWPGNEVGVDSQISFWQRTLGSASVSSPDADRLE